MTSEEFVEKVKEVADDYKTVYANGMFGQPITKSAIEQKAKQLPKWYGKNNNKENIMSLVGKGYFGFDCVCLIKSILWGWNGDATKTYGGAVYGSNGVPDISEDEMIKRCNGVSSNFENIIAGEVVWNEGHIGVYIGNGKVVECTPKWENGVQYTNLSNLGYNESNSRKWTKHGKLPYINYVSTAKPKPTEKPMEKPTQKESAKTVNIDLLVLRKGENRGNEQVKTLQRLLKQLGYYKGSIDGSFGGGTHNAVEDFQAERGLDADGVVGKATWTELLKG